MNFQYGKALLATLPLFFIVLCTASAQGPPVNGNGTIVEQMRPLSNFSEVLIDFSANVTITNGKSPSFRIEADENVLPHIGTRVRGRKLLITQDRWIEPSQRVAIHIGAPFASRLETSGYSNVVIENIDSPRLEIDAEVGQVILKGETDRLKVRSNTGTVDARQLNVSYVDVAMTSHAILHVNQVDELVTDLSSNALVVYEDNPGSMQHRNDQSRVISRSAYTAETEAEVQYIEFVLVNNSRKKLNLRVEGPRERSFGYGFSLQPNGTRKENWPVGTKVYAEKALLADELLLTLEKQMEDQHVDLFKED